MTARPVPGVSPETRPFWDGLREGRLLMPRCRTCSHLQMPMGPVCSECLGDAFDWVLLSGRGRVWSYIVYHHAFHPGFADRLPYNVALIELEEGPRVLSNVLGIAPDAVRNGMAVEAVFEPDGDVTLLCFRPTAT